MVDDLLATGGTAIAAAAPIRLFEDADVVVVNTCAFVDSAKQESVDAILEMVDLKESGQVQKVIAWRETWLQRQGLPSATVIRDGLADHFLEDAKYEFHSSDEQQELQQRDANIPGKSVQKGKHSRWSRQKQKLGGTTQMCPMRAHPHHYRTSGRRRCGGEQ